MSTTRVIYKKLHETAEIIIEDNEVIFKVDDFESTKKEYLRSVENAFFSLDQNYAGTENNEVKQQNKQKIKIFLLGQIQKLKTMSNPNLTFAENVCKNNPHLSLEKTANGFTISHKPK
jgi:hypothetical protein